MKSLHPRTPAPAGARHCTCRLWLACALVLPSLAAAASPPTGSDTATNALKLPLTSQQHQQLQVATLEPDTYRNLVTTTGSVGFDRDRTAQLAAPFSGTVIEVLVHEGQKVAAGQVLARVVSPDFTAAAGAYRKAVRAAKAADAVAANDRALAAQRAIPERENAQAQADAASADADRAAALQALAALHTPPATLARIRGGTPLADIPALIRAPIGGVVITRTLAPGQTLSAGSTPCFVISDPSHLWVTSQLFGPDIRQVQIGDPATVDPGDGSAPLAGAVTHISAVVNADTHAVDVRIPVAVPDHTLRQGMYVTVRLHSRTQHRGLLAPVGAVLRNDENQPFVYLVEPDDRYARRSVTLGPRIGDRFLIADGLTAGDRIVVSGALFLHFVQSQ